MHIHGFSFVDYQNSVQLCATFGIKTKLVSTDIDISLFQLHCLAFIRSINTKIVLWEEDKMQLNTAEDI